MNHFTFAIWGDDDDDDEGQEVERTMYPGFLTRNEEKQVVGRRSKKFFRGLDCELFCFSLCFFC